MAKRIEWMDGVPFELEAYEVLVRCNVCGNPVVMPEDAEEPPVYYCGHCY